MITFQKYQVIAKMQKTANRLFQLKNEEKLLVQKKISLGVKDRIIVLNLSHEFLLLLAVCETAFTSIHLSVNPSVCLDIHPVALFYSQIN